MNMNIVVAGKSEIKRDATAGARDSVRATLEYEIYKDHPRRDFLVCLGQSIVFCKDGVDSIVPPQPYELDETTRGAEHRALEAERLSNEGRTPEAIEAVSKYEVYVGIENGVCTMKKGATPEEDVYADLAVIAVRYKGKTYFAISEGLVFPTKYVLEAKAYGNGQEMTVGKVIAKHLGGDHANPHSTLTGGLTSRHEILEAAVYNAFVQIG